MRNNLEEQAQVFFDLVAELGEERSTESEIKIAQHIDRNPGLIEYVRENYHNPKTFREFDGYFYALFIEDPEVIEDIPWQ